MSIMQSLPAEAGPSSSSVPNPDASPSPADIIGPLSIQVLSTINKVKLYTSALPLAPARGPSTPSAGPPNLSFARGSISRSSIADQRSDPFLLPIFPHPPLATLPALYYPGVTPTLMSAGAAPARVTQTRTTAPAAIDQKDPEPIEASAARRHRTRSPTKAAAATATKGEGGRARGDDESEMGRKKMTGREQEPATAESCRGASHHRRRQGTARKRSGKAIGERVRPRWHTGHVWKVVSEDTREKASRVTAKAKTSEQAMQRKHMETIERRRGQQLERVKIPAQL